jgi:hypothetical protein
MVQGKKLCRVSYAYSGIDLFRTRRIAITGDRSHVDGSSHEVRTVCAKSPGSLCGVRFRQPSASLR